MKEITRKNIAGVWSATPTPFTDKLELDVESISRLVEHHVCLGIKGLFLGSHNGEGHLMTDSMRMELAAEVAKSNQDRMLLSMLVADNPAQLMIDNIKHIEDSGIDIAVINFPFTLIKIEQEHLKELYFSVLEKSSLPIALCHIGRVSSDPFEIALLQEIIRHQKVFLIEDCSCDLERMKVIFEACMKRGREFFAITGNEFNCGACVRSGYEAFLLNSACFTGFIANKILEFAQDDKPEKAQEIQNYMNSLLLDVFGLELEHYLVGQKQVMVELGIFNTAKTLQDYPITDELVNTIKELFKQGKEFLLPKIK